jgi:molecular chaperone GrpE
MAEMQNTKRRNEEERSKILKYDGESLIKDLLPIIDNFERAIKLNGNDLALDTSKFLEGFKMIYCNTVSILEKYGVQAIDGSSKPFDPNYHEAVISEHIDGVEPGMVIEVLQKGYLLKGKVIRHAMVKVSA